MKIPSIQLVSAFKYDPAVILSCGASIQSLEKALKGKVLQLNVPESAPPDAPRLILQSKDTILSLGFTRLELTVRPPQHVHSDFSKAHDFAIQRAQQVLAELSPCVKGYEWSGVITTIEYPNDQKPKPRGIEAVRPVFDNIINVNIEESELASFQTQLGFKVDGYNLVYVLNGYEGRGIKIGPDSQGKIIDVEEFPIDDSGIQITLDVNNRAGDFGSNPLDDLTAISLFQKEKAKTLAVDLNLEGVIS